MSVKLVAECEYCGHQQTIESLDELEDLLCEECDLAEQEPEQPVEVMSEAERKERYRLQYKANGFSWLGIQPWMWKGDLQ